MEPPPADEMAPSALDLLFLTFNCAKNFINVAVFASHLQGALSQGVAGGALPDLVVFSLQEVAPLSYSFIGSYFLTPYYSRYEEALNLAAAKVLTTTRAPDDDQLAGFSAQTAGSQGAGRAPYPYTLVRSKNVGMTAILLFARDPSSLHHIAEAECGFGAADLGNKGAVGLRVAWSDGAGEGETEVTFVATHLAAMEWNLKKRNANWRSIVSGLLFENPKTALPGVFGAAKLSTNETQRERERVPDVAPPSPASASSSEGSEEDSGDAMTPEGESDSAPLLERRGGRDDAREEQELDPEHLATLQRISIFKPGAHLFLAGDLNYRISSTSPPARSDFPSFYHPEESHLHYAHFLKRDQLTTERMAGRTLNGLTEAPITFGPSYKYDVLDDDAAETAENAAMVREKGEVPWRWAPHRWPSWCDRVLYLDTPGWLSRAEGKAKGKGVEVKAYDLLPVMRSSDHRPVFFRASVPMLSAEEMAPPEGEVLTAEERRDPRLALPVPVDVHAWERRAAARRKEIAVGLSMFLWATKEGAVLIGTTLLLGGVGWWAWRVW